MHITRIFFALISFLFILSMSNVGFSQSLVEEGSEPEVVAKGFQFTEGPFWHPEGYLLFSDIPANTIYKWHPDSAAVQAYITPSGHSNGITWDPAQKRVIVAQHDGKISAIADDSLHILASNFQEKRLNSPNDAAVRADGTIYFTDPPFGVSEGNKELDVNGVYRIENDGTLQLLYDKLARPNGIVFSPDESTLYVNDLADGQILSFKVTSDGNLSLPTNFADVGQPDSTGAADGMVVDTKGRLYSTGPGGIHIFDEEGKLLETIALPARATNLEWGRAGKNELYISTPSAIYRLQMKSKRVSD